MQVLHEQFADDDGVSLLAVHYDSKGDPAAYLAEHKLTFPTIMDGRDITLRFDIKMIPTFIVIDADGEIIHKHVGRLTDDARDEIGRVARDARSDRG